MIGKIVYSSKTGEKYMTYTFPDLEKILKKMGDNDYNRDKDKVREAESNAIIEISNDSDRLMKIFRKYNEEGLEFLDIVFPDCRDEVGLDWFSASINGWLNMSGLGIIVRIHCNYNKEKMDLTPLLYNHVSFCEDKDFGYDIDSIDDMTDPSIKKAMEGKMNELYGDRHYRLRKHGVESYLVLNKEDKR